MPAAFPGTPQPPAVGRRSSTVELEQGGPATGLRLFASTIDEPRGRRATDLLIFIGSTVGLIALGVAFEPTPRLVAAFRDVVASSPDILETLWLVFVELLWIVPVALVVGVAIRRRTAVLRDLLIALAVAGIVWQIAGRTVSDSWPSLWDALRSSGPPPWYPAARIVLCGTVLTTAAPHLVRPIRRLGRYVLAGGTVGLVMVGATTEMGAVAGLLVAGMAASIVHLAFGSSGGRPGLDFVRASLAELGVNVDAVGAADRQEAGMFAVDTTAADGSPLVVKVYGRDAYDSALVNTVWRRVWLREPGAPIRLGRLQQVEHEALLTLFVGHAGIPTDEVVTAGATVDDDALLVLRRSGHVLTYDDDRREPVDLDEIWALVDRLHGAGVAHGSIDAANILVRGGDGALGLVDFRGATLGAEEADRRTDETQAFITTVLLGDAATAIEAAQRALGPDGVAKMLPFLQRSVLTPAQRHETRRREIDLDDLRAQASEAIGHDPPKLAQLRRITVGSFVRVLLPAFAVLALLSGLAGLDFAVMRDVLANAAWWLVFIGAVLAQTPRITQSVSTLGASPVPLPLGPVVALQLAVSYVNLAIPSSAARMAVNIRFFQRHGVPPGAALTAGAIDGFSGFIVQAILMFLLLVLTPAALDLDLNRATESANPIALVVIVIAVVALGVVAVIGRARRLILKWARQLGGEALSAARNLRSPRRLALLFGGNLATELLFAITLGTFTRAVGYPIGLAELLVINISVGLLAGLLPIPGGIGVVEGGLTYGLVRAGMPEEVALTAVLMYRLATFYLPPIWGFFALRWLERNQHL